MAAKFAHTLRMRLMREHLGVNIDIVDVVEKGLRDLKILLLQRKVKIRHQQV